VKNAQKRGAISQNMQKPGEYIQPCMTAQDAVRFATFHTADLYYRFFDVYQVY